MDAIKLKGIGSKRMSREFSPNMLDYKQVNSDRQFINIELKAKESLFISVKIIDILHG